MSIFLKKNIKESLLTVMKLTVTECLWFLIVKKFSFLFIQIMRKTPEYGVMWTVPERKLLSRSIFTRLILKMVLPLSARENGQKIKSGTINIIPENIGRKRNSGE